MRAVAGRQDGVVSCSTQLLGGVTPGPAEAVGTRPALGCPLWETSGRALGWEETVLYEDESTSFVRARCVYIFFPLIN